MDAVEILTGKELANWTPPPKKEEKNEPKVLRLTEKYQDSKRIIQYLFNRGIDYQIIQECIADGVIFESNGRYHNVVFVGKDETGTPKYAAYRGLGNSTFKGDAYGSDKQYSFAFNTLTEKNEYEILAAFKTVVYTDSPEAFKYYRFTDAQSPEEFDAYIEKCKELSLYDTGVSAEYGDKLITLSTCEYSRTNGRLVVVAKKVTESSGANAPANDGAAEIPS